MRIIKYILLLTSILSVVACSKKLDLQPQNNITADVIKTSADVKALLFGAYEGLQGGGAFGEGFILTPDLIASDSQINFVGTFQDYQAIQHKIAVSTNSVASALWGSGYKIINLCNTVLDKLSIVDSAARATIQGEALFMRGTVYFQLVGLYGKPYSDGAATTNLGVPIVLQPTYLYDPKKNMPSRATVDQVYTQIITDLQTAISRLPSSNSNYRATLYSAKAILTRVFMSMGRYADAATQAADIISSGNFSLMSTYDKEFNLNGTSPEDLFAIQQSTQSNVGTANNGLTTFYSPQPAGRGDALIDTLYFTFFGSSDFRGIYVTQGTSIAGYPGYYPNKWAQFYKTIPVVRLAEMYLTRGEANLLSGGSIGDSPLNDINAVRGRAGASMLTTVSGADFVNERMRELGFEGDRFWTLKRVKTNINGLGYDDDKLILPIPQSEIDVNKNLKQNIGY